MPDGVSGMPAGAARAGLGGMLGGRLGGWLGGGRLGGRLGGWLAATLSSGFCFLSGDSIAIPGPGGCPTSEKMREDYNGASETQSNPCCDESG